MKIRPLQVVAVLLLTILVATKTCAGEQEWDWYGDIRYDYLFRNAEHQDLDDLWRTRLRFGIKQSDPDKGAWDIRLANNYLSSGENTSTELSLAYPEAGEADKSLTTLDRLNWHKRWEKWSIRVGRFTYRSVLKSSGGLSLDRKNTIATVVDWTDGIELNFNFDQGWKGQFLLQHEAKAGPSSTRRGPLDFSPLSAGRTLSLAIE